MPSFSLSNCWHRNCANLLSNGNLFIYCCVAACISLLMYLAAFSCEVSWLLESRGDLPTPAYLLCSGYFIMFIASTILIHGLATGLPWGLLSWSVIIGFLSIPELCFVMVITTQYWGLQSTHGLTELVGYLIRLVINCLALLCVIPTALRWRKESKIHQQLQSLANRLQLTTPVPMANASPQQQQQFQQQQQQHQQLQQMQQQQQLMQANGGGLSRKNSVAMQPMQLPYGYFVGGSRNEFDTSVFLIDAASRFGTPDKNANFHRAQSLVDLRPAIISQNNTNTNEKSRKYSTGKLTSIIDTPVSQNDPIYYTIASEKSAKSLNRKCISLENLDHFNFAPPQFNPYYNFAVHPYAGFAQLPDFQNYYTSYTMRNPSKQSLGTESDDFRKYRDVAL